MDREQVIERIMRGEEVGAVDAARAAATEDLSSLRAEAERRLAQQRTQEERASRREALITELLRLDAEAQRAEVELAENDAARREATRPFDEREIAIRERWHECYVKFSPTFREVCGRFATESNHEVEALRRELRERGAVLDRVLVSIGQFPLSPSAQRYARERNTAEGN
ncbi:MAG TPA: hypothetical protein VK421_13305 [Pyrinomonadaceae bacterium]|nr:hypothetical protein [Pyrinomonadaceae bacterium]